MQPDRATPAHGSRCLLRVLLLLEHRNQGGEGPCDVERGHEARDHRADERGHNVRQGREHDQGDDVVEKWPNTAWGHGSYGLGAYGGHAPSWRPYDRLSYSGDGAGTTTTTSTTTTNADETVSPTGTLTISRKDAKASYQGASTTSRTTAGSHGARRLAGRDRYQTMAAVSAEGFASSSRAVVATGESFAGALAASGLAGAMGCPVVLTDGARLSGEAKSELSRLGVTSVTLVGGTSAVSEAVRLELESMGIHVTRVAGGSRQATSVAAMGALRAADGSSDTVVVASGSTFADALATGPWAWRSASPVLLTSTDGT